jgi:hypothetical protein
MSEPQHSGDVVQGCPWPAQQTVPSEVLPQWFGEQHVSPPEQSRPSPVHRHVPPEHDSPALHLPAQHGAPADPHAMHVPPMHALDPLQRFRAQHGSEGDPHGAHRVPDASHMKPFGHVVPSLQHDEPAPHAAHTPPVVQIVPAAHTVFASQQSEPAPHVPLGALASFRSSSTASTAMQLPSLPHVSPCASHTPCMVHAPTDASQRSA